MIMSSFLLNLATIPLALSLTCIIFVYCRGYYFMYPIESTAPPMVVERAWERRPFHYDNVFMAMLTLFAVQTSEGWVA